MLIETLLFVAIALSLVFLLRVRRQVATLAEQIRELRAHAVSPITYREADVALVEVDDASEEAESAGFAVLGDFVEASDVRPDGMPMRWIVDRAGTTFGWLAPFDVGDEHHIILVLMSHELDSETITSRAPVASSLARPPFVKTQYAPLTASVAETVTRHRRLADLDDDKRGFVPVKTFEQLRLELARMRGKAIAWRETQPAAELLDADLRSLLGAGYARVGPAVERRLRGQ